MATLAWPKSAAEARGLLRHPLDFVRCADCGHVFNVAFDYAAVPYSDKPNLMFNQAVIWSRFLTETTERILSRLGESPTVIEIGHGDGRFLSALAQARPKGRYVGFDPHGATESTGSIEFRRQLFSPLAHLGELRPDIVLSRHVLEHLVSPLGFLQGISFVATALDLAPLAYFEVPCIDTAISSRRTVDFYSNTVPSSPPPPSAACCPALQAKSLTSGTVTMVRWFTALSALAETRPPPILPPRPKPTAPLPIRLWRLLPKP